jgi:hypothetical protein
MTPHRTKLPPAHEPPIAAGGKRFGVSRCDGPARIMFTPGMASEHEARQGARGVSRRHPKAALSDQSLDCETPCRLPG